ncbi:glycosyltransferase [Butyrivibrio fibrisolvens]|uniref:glycosyltransferase n=1 Tax=Butyrivibrio fibrisolvens TaxID=831 RepID=UPI0024A61C1D|nr:glycosyltransferase [Butyrivibrio fibrisolvens]
MVYFNLPEWRKHDCEQRIVQHVKKYGDIYGSKDQGILLCTVFIDEYAQLPLKYNIYGMTYYFNKFNRRLFNNAPVISKNEIDDAYSNPEIIHLA